MLQKNLMFKFFKNPEIPEFYYCLDGGSSKGVFLEGPTQKAVLEDYLDFNITLIDNGDDKLCLQGNPQIIL